ncbi:MAG: peptide chain release factor N(5)-glutamine methyltransferase [Wenzhouxiangella sp.]|nr:peptide chain release factor N(5)-glutamine methyltransferase [Wenzhouxiangella sp.]
MNTTALKTILATAKDRLNDPLEAEVLVAHALGADRSYLYAHSTDPIDSETVTTIHHLIKQRQLGTPVAYLLGHREFYGRLFKVTPDVLIPRPETEAIIDQANALNLSDQAKVVDVGTGSGCIGLTLALEHPSWTVCVTDACADALSVCRDNRQAHQLTNVAIHQGDLLEALSDQTFDLIVANLPYVAPNDPHLSQGDLPCEPQHALVADQHGLALIERLIADAPHHLIRPGHLIIEHGFDQQTQIVDMLRQHGFDAIKPGTDLAATPRLVVASIWH